MLNIFEEKTVEQTEAEFQAELMEDQEWIEFCEAKGYALDTDYDSVREEFMFW